MANWKHNYSGRLHRAACLIDTASGRKLLQRQAGYSTPSRLVVALQASDKQLGHLGRESLQSKEAQKLTGNLNYSDSPHHAAPLIGRTCQRANGSHWHRPGRSCSMVAYVKLLQGRSALKCMGKYNKGPTS